MTQEQDNRPSEAVALLPCPFCETSMQDHGHCFSHPRPTSGDCFLRHYSFDREHRSAWNTRARPSPAPTIEPKPWYETDAVRDLSRTIADMAGKIAEARTLYGHSFPTSRDIFAPLECSIDELRVLRHELIDARPAPTRDGLGWIVSNGAGTCWRMWKLGNPVWTNDRTKATRYARREDAEAAHAEDEDAWSVVPYSTAPTSDEAAVEAVARAICGGNPDEMVEAGNPIGEPCEYPRWMLFQLDARAAITAYNLARPVEGLLREAMDALDYLPIRNTRSIQASNNIRTALANWTAGGGDG